MTQQNGFKIKCVLMTFLICSSCFSFFAYSQQNQTSELIPLVELYTIDRANLVWTYDIPLSEEKQKRMGRFYSDWQNQLMKLDFERLSLDGKMDYLLFNNILYYEKRMLEREKKTKCRNFTIFAILENHR